MSRIANLRWVASGVFPLTVVLMESLWVYPWLTWAGNLPFFKEPQPLLSLWSVLLLLGVSLFLSRAFLGSGWRLGWVRAGIVLAGLAAVFISLRLEYADGSRLLSTGWLAYAARAIIDSFSHPHPLAAAPFVGVFLWWRGIGWGRSALDFRGIYRAFGIGVVALVLLIIVRRVSATEGPTSGVGLYVAGFFLFGLAALALSNLQAVQQKMRMQGEGAAFFSRRWVYLLFGVAGSIIVLAIAIASLLSREFIAILERFLSLAFDLLLQGISYLLIPVGYAVEGLFRVFQFIVNLFRREPQAAFPSVNMSPITGLPDATTLKALPPEALLAIKWSLFAFIIAVLVFLLVRAVFRYRARTDDADVDEFDESLWSWAGFKTDLRLLFNTMRQNLGGKKGRRQSAKPVPPWSTGDVPDTMNVREIYQRLLWETAGLGMGRRRHETPNEYARRLGMALPEGNEELGEITALYVGVRYGGIEPPEPELREANRLWRLLRGIMDKLRGVG